MTSAYSKAYNSTLANINILIRSDMHLAIIVSPAGMGKSHLVLEMMKKLNYNAGEHYLYFNSYFTSLGFYQALTEVAELSKPPRLMILDDTETILRDKNIINLIKASTWQTAGKRIIHYSSTSSKVKNKTLEFNGKIIMLLNELPEKNPMFNAIMDRSLFVELKFSNQEVLELMETEIVPKNFNGLSITDKFKVLNFIKSNITDKTDLSFRTLIKSFNYYLYSKNNWMDLTKKLL